MNGTTQAQYAIPNQQQYRIVADYFVYTASFGTILQGETPSVNVAIEADSQFVIQKMTYAANIVGASQQQLFGQILPNLTMSITDSGSGRNLQNEAIPLYSIAGTGFLPYILNQPKELQANSTLTVKLANIGTDDYENVYINFIGKKLFSVRK